ncbi:MAG: 50S ribosomal protein L23 [Nitrospinae bacterium]|nr:50S ribosomal protein L23 [Nitrospinota bacterium]
MESTFIIRRPCVTEKSIESTEMANKVVFEVAIGANKIEIKKAVQELFGVTVLNVNTMRVPGKKVRMGRYQGTKPAWKKAIVTLREGDTIEFFEST